jgi:2-polyprenyl-6-methoxyphenol hydroxylase-like FAD-dependent oxidoreductase
VPGERTAAPRAPSEQQRFDVDVAIVGAGPGGATCALACVELGLTVALFDPRLAPATAERVKPCGEGLMPAGADALRRLGFDPDRLGRRFEGVRYFAPGATPLALDFPAPGVAIHRGVLQGALDARLHAERRISSVAAVAGTERVDVDGDVGFAVSSSAGCTTARVLVAADGGTGHAAPWLRDRLHAKPGRRGRVGLRVHCEPARPLDRVEVHFGAACEVYLTPLPPSIRHPSGLVNVVLLFDSLPAGVRGGEALLAHALARHPRAAEHIGAPVGPVEARALDFRRPAHVAANGAFLVGDAGGGVDPVLGCGTTVALRTGLAAALGARALCDGAPAATVARDYERLHARETTARRRVAAFLIAASRSPRTARAVIALARALPSPTRALVGFAARVEPLVRGSSLASSHVAWAR